jgi:hypothetical protein
VTDSQLQTDLLFKLQKHNMSTAADEYEEASENIPQPLSATESARRIELAQKAGENQLTEPSEYSELLLLTQRELNYQHYVNAMIRQEREVLKQERDVEKDRKNDLADELKRLRGEEGDDDDQDLDQNVQDALSHTSKKAPFRFGFGKTKREKFDALSTHGSDSDAGGNRRMAIRTLNLEDDQDVEQLQRIVKGLFHSEVDSADSKAFNFKREDPPTLGRKGKLSENDEKRFKSLLGKFNFTDRTTHSHSIGRLLRTHSQFVTETGLNNEKAIETLERLGDGAFYDLCHNLKLARVSIAEVYDALQMTFRERVSPMEAERKIQEIITKPPHREITPNLHAIYQQVATKYEEAPEESRDLETTYEAITKTYDFLTRNYGMKKTEIVRIKFDTYKNRLAMVGDNTNVAPYTLFLKLASYAETFLRVEEKTSNQPAQPSYLQGRRIREAVQANVELTEGDIQHAEEAYCQALEQRQQQFLKGRLFNPNPQLPMRQQAATDNKCYLCNNTSEVHNPIWYKRCTVFPGQEPLMKVQRCCQGHHADLHGKPCPSLEARKQAVNSIAAEELKSLEQEALEYSSMYQIQKN